MGFWYKRTPLEKKLIVSIGLFLLLSVGLLIGLLVVIIDNSDSELLVCDTPECLIAAAEIQSSLNTSANPCEDFYEYSCGGWMNNNIIPRDRSRWSQFDVTRKKLLDDLRVIFEGDINYNSYPSIVGKTVGLYKQCLNTTKRDSDDLHDLKNLVTSMGWPMISQGILDGNYDWTKVYAKLNKEHGFSFIFSNYVYLDAKNTTEYSIYVDAPSFGVGRTQLTKPDEDNNKKILDAYEKYIRDVVTLMSATTYPDLTQDITDMINFEKDMAKITMEPNDRRDRQLLYGNKTNLNGFMTTYTGIPLIEIERQVFGNATNINIENDSPLIVYDRGYFSQINSILSATKAKNPRTIANYLSWRTVKSLGGYTTTAMRDIEFQFSKVVSGVEEPKPIWEECIETVNSRLPFAVGRLYVDQKFSEEAKQDMIEMISQLNVAFTQLLNDNNWMEKETKDKALIKLQLMLEAIGYPDMLKDNNKLENYYNGNEFDSDSSFLKSIEANNQWSTQRSLNKLVTFNTNREELDWTTGPAIVNAFFSPNINRITFPAGILQSPFYTLGLPVSLNLGAIGVVIGHEITHSFDDSGSQYDGYGNLFNWWDDITQTKFQERVGCFKDQYSSYNDSLAGRPVNGNLTIGENIADNGGLRQAFRALENYGGKKQLLPGSMSSFTNEQLFFLSFANVWCTNIRREALISQIETDPHSPGKYRVWGSVSNSESFARAFNCKSISEMNPENRCILW